MGSVRDTARRAENTANLRTLHQGMMSLVMEGPPGLGKGSGYFPSYAGLDDDGIRYVWTHLVAETLGLAIREDQNFRFLQPLEKSPFHNPFREDVIVPDDSAAYQGLQHRSHYAYNVHLGSFSSPVSRDGNPPYGHVNLTQVENPSRTILITESDGDNLFDAMGHAGWAPPGRNEAPDRAACVFVDGSVAILDRQDILANPSRYLHPHQNNP